MKSFKLRVMAQVLPFLLDRARLWRWRRRAAEPRRGDGGDEGGAAPGRARNTHGSRSIS